jgi:glucosamine-6-phosphate deaminase
MKVIITKNYEEMSAKAARFVLAHLWRKPDIVLGLPTGSTPIGMYENFSEAYNQGRADFSRVATFNLDEYVGLGQKDPDSYHSFMSKHLFNHINIKKQNIHIPNGAAKDLASELEQYESDIKDYGRIDLQVLGIAPNGHIGFNEPGTEFAARTHIATLTPETRRKNAKHLKSKKTPESAITVGLGTIMESKKIVLIASGKDKADAVAKTIEGKVNKDIPASLVQWHSDVTVILDEQAASKLKRDYASPFLFDEGDVEVLTENDLPTGKFISVISPHPDDASISLGGVIGALSKRNRVNTIIMTTGYRSEVSGLRPDEVIKIREREAREESKILGSKPIFMRSSFYDAKHSQSAMNADVAKLTSQFKKTKPDIVFVPQAHDRHPTHSASRDIALRAIDKYVGRKKDSVQVYNYEGLWSLFAEGEFNTAFAYDESLMKKKIQAINAQKSQLARTRFDVAAKSLARLRASIVPEQALVGYGAKAPKLGKYFELFEVNAL